MNFLPPDCRIQIGQIVKTQGLKGQVRITCSQETEAFSPGKTVYVEKKQGIQRFLTVDSFRFQGPMGILSFQEIKGIQGAEELVGGEVFVEKGGLPPLAPGEYYWYELQGLKVKTEKGVGLGEIIGVFGTGSNDVFVVQQGQKEILIPATQDVIAAVNLAEKVLVIRPIEGLLPDDDL